MRIYDVPRPVERALYEEAADIYARGVASRADAVYLIGNITYPGLSDLDLLVLTESRRIDNAQFFSSLDRLDSRFSPILLHEPLIVPPSMLDVLKYTTHRHNGLLAGRDILPPVQEDPSLEERWCRLLEGYCTYATFVRKVHFDDAVRGRRLIAKTSSLRFSLRELDALCGTNLAPGYAATIDRIRASFFEGDAEKLLLEAWSAFQQMFGEITKTLRDRIDLAPWDTIDDFAERLFAGKESMPQVSAEYVSERSKAIDHYHEELVRMHLPYGQIFFWEAHGRRSRIYEQSRFVNIACRIKYKIERMLRGAASSGAARRRPVVPV